MMKQKSCQHIDALDLDLVKKASQLECAQCVEMNSTWVHLRTCQTCGITLCCDSSINKHASAHAIATDHPVITSAEPGESWMWCYKDKVYLKLN
jgi:hypothetical protein